MADQATAVRTEPADESLVAKAFRIRHDNRFIFTTMLLSACVSLLASFVLSVDALRLAENPDLVLWNGHANQYVHEPLTARVGERVRLWVLAAGPSRGTTFHVVGGQFDTVFKEGEWLLRPNEHSGGAQALNLGPSQGGFVEMVFTEPGSYTFVNHSFVDAERGARGIIRVV